MENIRAIDGRYCPLSKEAHVSRVSLEIINRADLWPWLSDEEKVSVWEGEGSIYLSRIISGLYWHAYVSGFDIESVVKSAKYSDVDFAIDSILELFTPKSNAGVAIPHWVPSVISKTRQDTLDLVYDQLRNKLKLLKPAQYLGTVTNIFFDRSMGMAPVFETLFPSSNQPLHKLDIPKIELYSLDSFCLPLTRRRKV